MEVVVCGGGLNQVTPVMSLKSGIALQALNYECLPNAGYGRIYGYERFSGKTSPSSQIEKHYIQFASFINIPAVGSTLTTATGSAVIAYVNVNKVCVVSITGNFTNGQTAYAGTEQIGIIVNAYVPLTAAEDAILKGAIADLYRSYILTVPGSGLIRGVVMYKGTVYAFRDNVGATAIGIYKSSSSGWVNVPYYQYVNFTAGTTEPADGSTLTQGGVTATVKRVSKRSGAWTGDAAGIFVISGLAGGHFAAGAASLTGGTTVTLSGVESNITLAPGGRFEFNIKNFHAQSSTERVYGCDGVNKAFEFDGDVLVPIATGASSDTPKHLICHRDNLYLSIGATYFCSSPADPYNFSALAGAYNKAIGEDITAFVSLPGGTSQPTLGIFSRNNTFILYGDVVASLNLVVYNSGTGASDYTVQNMSQTLAYDDRGANSIQTSLQYGNFSQTSLTSDILPFIKAHIGQCSCATLCRSKSQYRIFFTNGDGLYITIVNGKLSGIMPVYFPDYVSCVWEGKDNNGADVIFFGSSGGYIYQMEKGSSFDGEPIPHRLVLNFATARSPQTLKTYLFSVAEFLSEYGYLNLDFGYSLGYNSSQYEQPNTTDFSAYVGSNRWDNFIWDNFVWDGVGTGLTYIQIGGTAENIALAISGNSSIVMPFSLNSITYHFIPRRLTR